MSTDMVDEAGKRNEGAELLRKKFKISMKDAVIVKYNLQEKISSEQKRQEKRRVMQENSNKISNIISYSEQELQTFLSSGKSYSQFDRDRLNIFFEGKMKQGGELSNRPRNLRKVQ